MRIAALLILAALAVLGFLFLLGIFDQKAVIDTEPGVGPAGGDASSAGGDGTGALAGSGPREEPPIEVRRMAETRSLLVVAPNPEPWNQTLLMAADDVPSLRYATWYTDRAENTAPTPGPGAGVARGLDAPSSAPDGAWLGSNAIDIVWLDRIDPNALPAAFWDALATRVREGRTGLWLRMGPPPSSSVHPLLTHPVLAPLLPIGKPVPFEGEPLPGVFPKGLPPKVTDAGVRHAASRLVPWPRWSRHWWDRLVVGDKGFRVEFVYPIDGVASGAETLLQAIDGRGKALPLLVASTGSARVLWQAWFDFDRPSQLDRRGQAHTIAWMTHALAWLAGEGDAPPATPPSEPN